METFPRYWPFVRGNHWSPVHFPHKASDADVFFDLRMNKRLFKQSRLHWFETPSCSLWRYCNEEIYHRCTTLLPEKYSGWNTHAETELPTYIRYSKAYLMILTYWRFSFNPRNVWRNDMETLSAFLASCEWKPPPTRRFPHKGPVM